MTMDCRAYTLVYFPPVEWTGLCQRPHHLARQMTATFGRTLFVQPSGLRPARASDLSRLLRHLGFTLGKKRGDGRPLPPGLEVVAAPQVPLSGHAWADALNGRLLGRRLRHALEGTPPERIILWGSTPAPMLLRLLPRLPRALFVFDWIDDYRLFAHLPQAVVETQERFVRTADVVFASSLGLARMAESLRPQGGVHVFPNGVDWEHWQGPMPEPGQLDGRRQPVIGYFGTLSHWLDRDLVSELAGRHPDWRFTFIGPLEDRAAFASVLARPNCDWQGPKPYGELPALARQFDVAWMPFRRDTLTESINPVKVYEYLALGLPVVAPPLPDLLELGEAVLFAEGLEAVEAALARALDPASRAAEAAERRRQEALRHAWPELWARALRALKARLL